MANFMTWSYFVRNFCTKIRGQIGSSEMISSNHMCRDFRLLHIYMPRQHCKRRSRDLKRGRVEPELTLKKKNEFLESDLKKMKCNLST